MASPTPHPDHGLTATVTAPVTAPVTITGISSMATRQLLAELAADFERLSGLRVALQAVGGVDAAKRVQAGEAFDVVLLASDAINKLMAAGHVQAGSRVDVVKSPVAIAVKAGAARPDFITNVSTEAALKTTVLAARSISFSTGPSGVYLTQLFERWGIAATVSLRMVQAPPGVPVGTLVASGEVELGFQQLSELMHLPGITVLGLLPGATAFITTFSAALGLGLVPGSAQHRAVIDMLEFFNSRQAAETKRRHGMEPA